ncbi:phenylalanine--tRNA ligase subunit beta [Myxococcota bacterium]|nr:phenylalanine--tRNA ligase subunit beta [Myxococcota bacterium]
MKISVNWLRRYVDFDWDTETLARRLTLSGSEVEGIERIRPSFTNVRIGYVKAVKPHPNADKLQLAQVELGGGEVEEVVCGAANCRAGLKVAYAGLGAVLHPGLPKEGAPTAPLKIKKAKIRGVTSLGMLCSEEELGLADAAPGIIELAEDAPIGAALEDYWPISDDVLDIGVTPNRGDCLSHLGIAREVAALAGVSVKYPEIKLPEQIKGEAIPVTIKAPQRCGRYVGRVIKGLKVGPSPIWMQRLLTAVGVRPINNLVDVTNFVLFEYGQPLHAFDLRDISGPAIEVRLAEEGEALTTLDGEVRALTAEDLLICDAARPVALAGVMGGLNSEVKGDTTDVLLESAYFQPSGVRMTARRTGLSSESSRRFERGVDAARTLEAANRALSLFAALSEGAPVVIEAYRDAHPAPVTRAAIPFSFAETDKRLGVVWSHEIQRDALTRLGFEVGDGQVKAPSWRSDIKEGADLVEEIARLIGYEKIPTPPAPIGHGENKGHRKEQRRRQIRAYLNGLGVNQALNYSFLSPQTQALFTDEPALELLNPLTEDHRALRRLLAVSLVGNARHNQRHAEMNVRLFELGRVFHPSAEGQQPLEHERLGILLSGEAARHWSGRRDYDFYDLKGAVEGLFEALELGEVTFTAAESVSWLHPGVAAEVWLGGEPVGVIGALHPQLQRKLKLKKPIYLAELELAPLLAAPAPIRFQDFTRFPASTRDLALIVPKRITAAQVLIAIEELSISVIDKVEIFDVYEGGDLAPSERSLGVSVRYRDAAQTLTEAAVTQAHERVIEHLKATFGVGLRS